MPRRRKPASPFRYFNSSSKVIRLVVMMYVRFPLSLRNVEYLLFERGINIYRKTVRYLTRGVKQLFACAPKIHPLTDQTSKILCAKEAWVPSASTGWCPRGKVSISRNLMGVGGAFGAMQVVARRTRP